MGNGFNDADKLSNNGWKGGALAVLEKADGTTNAQRKAAEALRLRNDVGVPRDIANSEDDEKTKALVATFKAPRSRKRHKLKVLDEDDYVSAIEKIIRRDFFPELPKLEAQHSYLTALENNDAEALRDIAVRYATPLRRGSDGHGASVNSDDTPRGFETPSTIGGRTPTPRHKGGMMDGSSSDLGTPALPSESPAPFDTPRSHLDGTTTHGNTSGGDKQGEGKHITNLSLDDFLDKYTSEDNESFAVIMDQTKERLAQKHAWLYRKVLAQREQLALTDANTKRKIKDAEHGMQMPIEGWHYTPKNALMYPPEGRSSEPVAKMIEAAPTKNLRSVKCSNTRFETTPFPSTGTTTAGMTGSSVGGHSTDGSEAAGSDSPKVNGYGFVVTPSPAPGQDLDPTMTWGFIEGTPFRLDAADLPQSHSTGPLFHIPEGGKRDQLGRKMYDDMHRKKRQRKREGTPSTGGTKGGTRRATTAHRLASMSPAAQRLGQSMLGRRGVGLLSSSYGGGGTRSPHTPVTTPRATPRSTPRTTPRSTPRAKSPFGSSDGDTVGGSTTSKNESMMARMRSKALDVSAAVDITDGLL